jgi:hypothetical protein
MCDEKIWYQMPMAELTFLFVIHRISLVKATMNAPRICKLGNGVNKMPNFFFFQLPKAEQRHLRICQLWRGGVFEP